jgi:hypothetical protein
MSASEGGVKAMKAAVKNAAALRRQKNACVTKILQNSGNAVYQAIARYDTAPTCTGPAISFLERVAAEEPNR